MPFTSINHAHHPEDQKNKKEKKRKKTGGFQSHQLLEQQSALNLTDVDLGQRRDTIDHYNSTGKRVSPGNLEFSINHEKKNGAESREKD